MTERPDAVESAQHKRRLIAIAFAALLVCSGITLAIGNQFFGWFSSSGWFSVEGRTNKAPVTGGTLAYIAGRTLYRPNKRPQLLARPVLASPLNPDDPALATSSPDGRYVVYQTVRSERHFPGTSFIPVLYVHDTVTRREKVLARGAHSAAWNRDGRIAYVKADHERYVNTSGEDNGQVVVQTLNGSPSEWTRQSNGYDVLAWAGDELLVEIRYCYLSSPGCREQPGPGVYALNRSGRLRPLNLAKLIALSPDGRYAFGAAERQMFNKELLTSRVRISRVDTGKAVATLNLTRPLRSLDSGSLSFSSGAWRGNSIVLTHGSSLVFLTECSQQLAFESIISVPRQVLTRMEYFWLLAPSSSTGPASERVAVAAPGQGRNVRYVAAELACSRSKRSCVRVAYLPRDRSTGTFALVANPGRP